MEKYNDFLPAPFTEYHEFSDDASLIECGLETVLMIEANWITALEMMGFREYEEFETSIREGLIKEDAIIYAEAINENASEKFANNLKKTWSYIEGIYAKFLLDLAKIFNKNKFLDTKEGKARITAGAKVLENEKGKVNGYLITADKYGLVKVKEIYDNLNSYWKDITTKKELERLSTLSSKELRAEVYIKMDQHNLDKKHLELDKAIGKVDNWPITVNAVNTASSHFNDYKDAKRAAKKLYDYSRGVYNTLYASLKQDISPVAVNLAAAGIARTLSIVDSAYLRLLKADYHTNCKMLLKSYNAGGKALGNVREALIDDNAYSITYTTESVASLFDL